jgi:glycosyltransferase involved in cell wall biosynthesis
VVTVHSLWGGLGPLPRLAAATATLRSAPVVWTAVSRLAAAQVADRLPPGRRVHVLPNAVDVAPRDATPAPRTPVQLVSTMRFSYRKRPLRLAGMFARLRAATDVPVELTVIGDGHLRPSLERRLRRLGVDESVTLTGRLEPTAVLDRLAAADLYVAPAFLESFGLAALEARSVGLPVVGRTGTGLPDFIEERRNGLLRDSDSGMVDALVELVEDTALRRRISEHNRTTSAELGWARSLERHDFAYALAVGEAAAPMPVPALQVVHS